MPTPGPPRLRRARRRATPPTCAAEISKKPKVWVATASTATADSALARSHKVLGCAERLVLGRAELEGTDGAPRPPSAGVVVEVDDAEGIIKSPSRPRSITLSTESKTKAVKVTSEDARPTTAIGGTANKSLN